MPEPSWIIEGKKHLGLEEIPGPKDTQAILDMAKFIGGKTAAYYKHDEIPWCGLYVGFCLKSSGYSLPDNPLGALNWNTWGVRLEKAVYGCVGTFHRGDPKLGLGHVGFILGQDDLTFTVLEGNTSDEVKIGKVLKIRLAGLRWPSGLTIPDTILGAYKDNSAEISTNEA